MSQSRRSMLGFWRYVTVFRVYHNFRVCCNFRVVTILRVCHSFQGMSELRSSMSRFLRYVTVFRVCHSFRVYYNLKSMSYFSGYITVLRVCHTFLMRHFCWLFSHCVCLHFFYPLAKYKNSSRTIVISFRINEPSHLVF